MEDELPPFHVVSEPQELVPITYCCRTCGEKKVSYQPYPREPHNTDFQQWCSSCRQRRRHDRIIPPKKEP